MDRTVRVFFNDNSIVDLFKVKLFQPGPGNNLKITDEDQGVFDTHLDNISWLMISGKDSKAENPTDESFKEAIIALKDKKEITFEKTRSVNRTKFFLELNVYEEREGFFDAYIPIKNILYSKIK